VFFLDGTERQGRIGMSDFTVLAVLHEYGMPVACVFSMGSDGGAWSVLPTASTKSPTALPSVFQER
jgi:hypothetical protein